ncbi:MAG: AAA family ATPase [Anaerolineaceae bacterium]|nr:AAA family ATPase [Anaerolineaceae bacterium]MCB9099457.1 AAA family ATPase [Anaerolineales bacterium]
MNRLRLSFFGPPEIYYDDQPLTFRTRKALALLIYLATEAGQQPREKLTALFWPESEADRGRAMLRTSLVHLRAVLDRFEDPYLIVERQALGFNPALDLDFDLHRLQQALNTLERQSNPPAGDQVIAQLQTAVDRYRGDFLEGFTLPDTPTFDDWVTLQREFWHGRVSRLFEALSQGYFERGDLANGIETATRWQNHDPFSEAAASRLMQLYFADHNRAAALQTYADYQTMLADEFGAVPSPEIEALAARIRANAAPQRLPDAPTPARAPADLAFVGRTNEFHHLQAIFERAGRGETQVALLTGEAGIGKTRLATEFLTWAKAQGADILPGRAFEAGGRLPYQPLIQCLRARLSRENAPDDLLSDIWLAELSRLLPELRDRYPDLAEPQPDEATAQTRLFEAITRLGQALARRAPLLIFLDDAQWADIASLDALQFALSRWNETRTPMMLLLSARSGALTSPSDLRNWLTRLKSGVAITRLDLHYLTRENTLALITALQARLSQASQSTAAADDTRPVPLKLDAFAEALHTETGGHPFFIAETIKALLEQNVLVPGQTDDGTKGLMWRTLAGETTGRFPFLRIIPTSVRQAILDRLARLTPTAKALLTSAAILGQEATFEQLCAVSAVAEMDGLEALEDLIGRRLLLEREAMIPTYLVAHDLLRTVLYEETGTARKRVLHRRAMTVLAGAAPARLAYHALAAGAVEAAFQYSVAAGDAAFALSAANEAADHYQTARQLLDSAAVPALAPSAYQHLYTRLGRALELNEQFGQALAIYEELGQIAKQHNAPTVELAALMAQVTILAVGGSPLFQSKRAESLLLQALALAQTIDDQVIETKILWRMMQVYMFSGGRFQECIDAGERALALAHQLDLPEQIAFILGDLALIYTDTLNFQHCLELATEAAQRWRTLGNRSMEVDALSKLMGIHVYMGQYEPALALSAEAYQISQAINNVWGQWQSRAFTGYVYWERGQPDQALLVLEDIIRLGEQGGYPFPLTYSRAQLALVYGDLGLIERGLALARLALEADAQFPMFRVHILAVLAQLHLRQGQLTEAQALVDQARLDPLRAAHPVWALYLPVVEAELAVQQEDYAQALDVTAAYLTTLDHHAIRLYRLPTLYRRGQALLGQNQPDAAGDCWLEARAAAEEMGARRWLWPILFALSGLEPDPAQATALHQQAREIVGYIRQHTPPDFRASFLDLPEVRAVLAE